MTDLDPPRAAPRRLSSKDFFDELNQEFSSTDRGVPFTLWNLLRRPGWVVRTYIEARDPRLTKPLRMALICLGAAALLLGLTGNLSDFAAGFVDGLSGQRPGTTAVGRDAAFFRAAVDFLGRFNLLLVLSWVPAAAAALRHSYGSGRFNVAEGFVFGLYTLALMLVVHTAVALLPLPALAWLALTMAGVPIACLAATAWGLSRAEGHGLLRAVGCALLTLICAGMLLLATLLLWAAWYAVSAQ